MAEEKLLPNEEEYLNSVIETFSTQMQGSGSRAGLNAAGTPKLQASSAASLSFMTICRRNFAKASMPSRKRSVAGSAFPDRILTSRRTSTKPDS